MRYSEGADLILIVEDEEVPLFLAEEEGAKQLNDGVAPETPASLRETPFGYENMDPRVSQPVSFEDWEEGAGFEEGRDKASRENPLRLRRYNYSRGVDLSWPGKALKSGKRQSVTGPAAAATKFFLSPTLGLFVLAGTSIWEYNTTTNVWDERDDASGDAVNYVDITELEGVMYASRGSTVDYKYSTDGITWSAFTTSNDNFSFWATRSGASNLGVLWGIKTTGNISNTPDGRTGATSWTLADRVGNSSETVNALLEGDDGNLYIFKREGIYRYTGSAAEDVWKAKYLAPDNGVGAYRHADGRFYAPYGEGLLQFDPLVSGTSLTHVYPGYQRTGNQEITGRITAISGDEQYLYVAVKNGAGNTYILKGLPDFGIWHTVLYLGANDCLALGVAPPAALHATNPTLLLGVGTATQHVILPRTGYDPETDVNYEFDTTSSYVVGPWLDYGAQTYAKFLNAGRTVTRGTTAARTVTLAYEVDDSGTFVDLVTSDSPGQAEATITADVSFIRLRYRTTLEAGSVDGAPVWLGSVLEGTPNPPRLLDWRPRILLVDDAQKNIGGRARVSASKTKRLLLKAPTVRCQLKDGEGNRYVVKVLDVAGGPHVTTQHGGRNRKVGTLELYIVEVGVVSLGSQEALIYGQDAWSSGKVWSATSV